MAGDCAQIILHEKYRKLVYYDSLKCDLHLISIFLLIPSEMIFHYFGWDFLFLDFNDFLNFI